MKLKPPITNSTSTNQHFVWLPGFLYLVFGIAFCAAGGVAHAVFKVNHNKRDNRILWPAYLYDAFRHSIALGQLKADLRGASLYY
ncbi:hypothetical protein BC937DRAFT_95557 [Endogone sp. FLAS-F59071]|nr:hypothetical protein BC937DRAFT_95557 [Endogone sp. FLAS-F59071]|eukprot:RUS20277.1 hypothetical protein BC937DRAFT_95557 [Endogone sp. FLAS-F59071]